MIESNKAKLKKSSKVRSFETATFKTCQRDNVESVKRSITVPDEPTTSQTYRKESKRVRTTPLTVEPTPDSLECLKKENKKLRASLKKILLHHANYYDKAQKSGQTQTEMIQELSNYELCAFNVSEYFTRTVNSMESRIKEDEKLRLMTALKVVIKVRDFSYKF